MDMTLTLTMAGAAAIINIWLAIRIGQIRTSEKIGTGDGGNDTLMRRMRAQANFVENAPFFLALVAALELAGHASMGLWIVGYVFMAGRIAHGVGMDGGKAQIGRMIGTIITLLTLLGLSIYAFAIVLGFTHH
jgi:uncharacterized membrane protein YecN with MAPEG domain